MQIMKLRIDKKIGNNLSIVIFSGLKNQTLQNTGTIILSVSEYQKFAIALKLGSQQMSAHFVVSFENEKKFEV